VARLQAAGIQRVFSVAATGANGQRVRRVRVGPVASVAEFDQLLATLAMQGFPEARLAAD